MAIEPTADRSDATFPHGGKTFSEPDWSTERVAGLECLDFRPDENTHYRMYRFTISNERDRAKSISSDTVMNLEHMR